MEDKAEEKAITVTVLFFSVLREETGTAERVVSLEAPARGSDLLDTLVSEYPGLASYRSSLRLAVNEEYVTPDIRLKEEDEVALITPVSGG